MASAQHRILSSQLRMMYQSAALSFAMRVCVCVHVCVGGGGGEEQCALNYWMLFIFFFDVNVLCVLNILYCIFSRGGGGGGGGKMF